MSAYTLFDAILDVGSSLRESYRGVVDASTTSTITDDRFHGDNNYWHEGNLLLIAAATMRDIYAVSGNVITVTPAMAATATAGSAFMLTPVTYPMAQIVAAINMALTQMGRFTQVSTDLIVTAGTRDYDLTFTVGATDYDLRHVVRVETTNDTISPYTWKVNHYWKERAGTLYFKDGYEPGTAGAPIRIWYNAQHPTVSAMTDEINAEVHPLRLVWDATAWLLRWRYRRSGKDEETTAQQLNEALAMADAMDRAHPIQRHPVDPHLMDW